MRLLLLVLGLTSLCSPRLRAGAPLDRISRDAGLYVVIDDLPGHVRELSESPLRERLESLILFQQWKRGADFRKLQGTLSVLNSTLDHSVPDVLLNLAGDQLVLAVYPQAEHGPAGVLISSPRDHDLALRTVELWNQLEHAEITQLKSGYWKRSTKNSTLYYLLTENRFALSDREALIRDLAVTPDIPPQESIREAPGWLRAQQKFDDRSWIRVWFRPETWPGILDLPDREPGLEMLLGQLKRAESATLEFDSEAGLHASFRLFYQPQREPELLIDYRTRYPATAGILDRPSRETMFLLSGRGGFVPLSRLLARGWSDSQAKETRYIRTVLRGFLQDWDPYEDVLPRMGGSWSIDIRSTEQEAARPVDLLLQVALQSDSESSDDSESEGRGVSRSSLASALENLLSTSLRILRDYETDSRGEVRTVNLNRAARLHVYQSASGWEPSFLVEANRVLISSSEKSLRDAFADRSPPQRNQFQTLSHRSLHTSQVGLFLNLANLRAELSKRPEAYLELFRVPTDKRSDSLAALALAADSLQLFDGGYLLWNCREEEWSVNLGVFDREK